MLLVSSAMRRFALLVVLYSWLQLVVSSAGIASMHRLHVVVLADCASYLDWQAIGMYFSWKESCQPGRITRVMCCPAHTARNYSRAMLTVMPTYTAASFTVNTIINDTYPAYNKPGAVLDWIGHVYPEEEWILLLDSDMLLRRPFYLHDFNLTRGWAVSHMYHYLQGVDNELAERHIPEIMPRQDRLAGPLGRRSDKVGGFFLIHRDDLRRIAPLWLRYTERVRSDPEAWRYSDAQTSRMPHVKPWISEMYGYSFGAAKANVWHKAERVSMTHPTSTPEGVPRLIHYNMPHAVESISGTWTWDKRWYASFNPLKCPPWNTTAVHPQEGIFPHPPTPEDLLQNLTMAERYRDLLTISTVHTLNAALCRWHMKRCPPSRQLLQLCGRAMRGYKRLRTAIKTMDREMDCIYRLPQECQEWALHADCKADKKSPCKDACRSCRLHTSQAQEGSQVPLKGPRWRPQHVLMLLVVPLHVVALLALATRFKLRSRVKRNE